MKPEVQPVRLSRRSHPYGFRQLSTTKDYYKYSFFPLAVMQWNCLPVHVVQMTDLDSFQGRHLFPPPPQTVLAVNTSLLTFWHLISFFPAQHF